MEDTMTEENKEPTSESPKVEANAEGNPEQQQEGKATPQTEQIDAKALQEKVETLTRQYNESTKEALRLKEVTASLEAKLQEKEQTSEIQDFTENVDPDVLKVFETMLESKLKPLQEKVGVFEKKETEQVLNQFIEAHPGLKSDEAMSQFNEELNRLKGVYAPSEAMEKAWLLCGGKELDSNAASQPVEDTTSQFDKQKQELLNQASGGEAPAGDMPRKSELEIKVKNAYEQAVIASQKGDPAEVDLWIKYNGLRNEFDSLQK